jgi:O-acetyl-ADP-ribose deacetylase (regulator of RNase III)
MPLSALKADLTTLARDAIVNAANEQLAQGGGVCGAVFRAAGAAELAAACRPRAPCPTGEARVTPGFRLPARHVIHAVGPVWHGGGQGEAALLAAAYRASLAALRGLGGRSIAFPAISTGIYGYPPDAAAALAVATVRDALAAGGDLDVTFCCFDDVTLRLYEKELATP